MSAHLAQDPANGARLLEDPVRMRAVAADLAASDPPLRNALVALVDLRIARSFLGDSAPSSGIRAHVAARLVDEQGIRSDVAARVVALLAEGDPLSAAAISAVGHETKPPARYTEATLIKELEDREIGRPTRWKRRAYQRQWVTSVRRTEPSG